MSGPDLSATRRPRCLAALLMAAVLAWGCGPRLEIAEFDLVGHWQATGDDPVDDDTRVRESYTESYRADGTFEATGRVEVYAPANGEISVSLDSTEHGTWKLQRHRIQKAYLDVKITRFVSNDPEVTREVLQRAIEDMIEEPEVLEILEFSGDRIVLHEPNIDETTTMVRIGEDQ